jgi:hypothetical protein
MSVLLLWSARLFHILGSMWICTYKIVLLWLSMYTTYLVMLHELTIETCNLLMLTIVFLFKFTCSIALCKLISMAYSHYVAICEIIVINCYQSSSASIWPYISCDGNRRNVAAWHICRRPGQPPDRVHGQDQEHGLWLPSSHPTSLLRDSGGGALHLLIARVSCTDALSSVMFRVLWSVIII